MSQIHEMHLATIAESREIAQYCGGKWSQYQKPNRSQKVISLKESPVQSVRYDGLQFAKPATTLSNRILQTKCVASGSAFDRDSVDVLGLFGPWGSGKSSLLAMVRENSSKSATWVDFDALKYQTESKILIPLLHHLAKLCGTDDANRFFRGLLKSVGQFVSDVIVLSSGLSTAKEFKALIKSIQKIPKSEKSPSQRLPTSRAHAIATAFDGLSLELQKKFGKRRIVIAIDNLDRCRPPALLELLESIHLLLESNNVSFVLALDQTMCIRSISSQYGYAASDAALYLEKMIPDYYRIPDPWVSDKYLSNDAIEKFLEYHLTLPECTSFHDTERARMLWEVIGSTTILRNPRRIKRLLRRLTLLPKDWFDDNKDSFLALLFVILLSDVWPELYSALPHTEPSEWRKFIEKTVTGEKQSGHLSKIADGAFYEFLLALRSWKATTGGRDAPGFSNIAKYDKLDKIVGEVRQYGV